MTIECQCKLTKKDLYPGNHATIDSTKQYLNRKAKFNKWLELQ